MKDTMTGVAPLTVTATPQIVTLNQDAPVTVRNTGTESLFFIHDPVTYPLACTGFAGTATELLAAGGTEVPTGKQARILRAPAWVAVVCATGLTTTMVIDAGLTESWA